MRCTLKILNIVHPNLIPDSPGTKRRLEVDPRRRRRSKSQTKTSPTRSAFHSTEETNKLDSNAKTPERLDTSMGSDKAEGEEVARNGERGKETEEGESSKGPSRRKRMDSDEEKEQSVFDEEMLRMLYEIIQGILVDALSVIEKVL